MSEFITPPLPRISFSDDPNGEEFSSSDSRFNQPVNQNRVKKKSQNIKNIADAKTTKADASDSTDWMSAKFLGWTTKTWLTIAAVLLTIGVLAFLIHLVFPDFFPSLNKTIGGHGPAMASVARAVVDITNPAAGKMPTGSSTSSSTKPHSVNITETAGVNGKGNAAQKDYEGTCGTGERPGRTTTADFDMLYQLVAIRVNLTGDVNTDPKIIELYHDPKFEKLIDTFYTEEGNPGQQTFYLTSPVSCYGVTIVYSCYKDSTNPDLYLPEVNFSGLPVKPTQ